MEEILYTVVLIAVGFLLKKCRLLREDDGEVISRIIFNLTLPALIIVSLNSVVIEPSIAMMPVLVILYGIISVLIAFLIFRKEERDIKGTFLMLASGYNVGLFAFPIVESIWGAEGLLYFGMFDVGNSFVLFGIAYAAGGIYSNSGMSMNAGDFVRKVGKSVPLVTYVAMIILHFAQIQLPQPFIELASIVSRANMPLSLILLGLYVSFSFHKKDAKLISKFLLFRYSLGLVAGLGCYLFLPFNEMFRIALLIGFLLPIGLSVIPFAYEFKYKTVPLIGSIINISMLAGILLFIIIPFFIT